jgi:hypothetical protein
MHTLKAALLDDNKEQLLKKQLYLEKAGLGLKVDLLK